MKFSKHIALPLLILAGSQAFAKPLAVVDSAHCNQLRNTHAAFILKLSRGEDLFKSIQRCTQSANIHGATLSGVGALKDPTLNYFNAETKQYQPKRFNGIYELIALHGNIATENNTPVLHLHSAISDESYKVYGGHLTQANIGVIGEVTIRPLGNALHRKMNKELGLKALTLDT